jgi:NADH:ubiquinone oxidoreductase subunit H
MVMGGFASNSPYATVGAQREMVLMMSYEMPLATVIVTLAWLVSNSLGGQGFSLWTISRNPVWDLVPSPLGWVGLLALLFAMLIVMPGKLSKLPFDQAEAETEICGGLLVEYSGRNLAMFYLADAVKTVAMSALVVALFFPYGITHWVAIEGEIMEFEVAHIVNFLFFLLKVLLVMFFSVTLARVSFARLQISDATYMYLVPVTLIALGGALCVVMAAGGL